MLFKTKTNEEEEEMVMLSGRGRDSTEKQQRRITYLSKIYYWNIANIKTKIQNPNSMKKKNPNEIERRKWEPIKTKSYHLVAKQKE